MMAETAVACPNGHTELENHCESPTCPWKKCRTCRFYGGRWSVKECQFVWREPVVKRNP